MRSLAALSPPVLTLSSSFSRPNITTTITTMRSLHRRITITTFITSRRRHLVGGIRVAIIGYVDFLVFFSASTEPSSVAATAR